MNKLLAALIAGFFAGSVNTAFAADTTAPVAPAATAGKHTTHVMKKSHAKTHTHAKADAKPAVK